AMPDSKGDVISAFGTGNLVALQITWTGTQTGAFTGPAGTIPASGKRQTTPAAMIVKFQGDKVKEIHHYFDLMTFLQQIGAMPDSKGDVISAFGTGNLVALQITWTGTQTGAFTGPAGTIPASGKRQTTPAAMIVKFQGDKVKEIHHYFDLMTFLQQIGAM